MYRLRLTYHYHLSSTFMRFSQRKDARDARQVVLMSPAVFGLPIQGGVLLKSSPRRNNSVLIWESSSKLARNTACAAMLSRACFR